MEKINRNNKKENQVLALWTDSNRIIWRDICYNLLQASRSGRDCIVVECPLTVQHSPHKDPDSGFFFSIKDVLWLLMSVQWKRERPAAKATWISIISITFHQVSLDLLANAGGLTDVPICFGGIFTSWSDIEAWHCVRLDSRWETDKWSKGPSHECMQMSQESFSRFLAIASLFFS